MQYGHFDDARREYVVTRPDTPRSWTNYLGSTEYGAIITNNAGGYSFIRSAALGRFLRLRSNAVPMDQPGRYLYLRDGESGDFWSASWQPTGKPLARYRSTCRHGTAYTVIESEYAGIATRTSYFVPLGQEFECWLLEVRNTDSKPRDLSLFPYVEFASEWNAKADLIDIQYSMCIVRCNWVDGMVDHIICNDLPLAAVGRPRQPLHTFFAAAGAEIAGFDTDREAFLGPYRTYANPRAVESGRCSGSLAWGDNACGAMQLKLPLAPGETREVVFLLGVGAAGTTGAQVRAEFGNPARARAELERVRGHWHSRLDNLTVQTPDAEFNSMVNVWNPYNCLITYAWSRAASLVYNGERDGLGFRDTVQDLLGVVPLIPEEARERLELMLTGQFANGGALPVVRPFEHRPGHETPPRPEEFRSDDCLWFFQTVPEYVKETGDLAFFRKVLPYADRDSGTVLDHLRRAILFSLEHRGRRGLPAALAADWNDCLGLGRQGESVMVAFQLRLALVTYADICRRLGEEHEAAWADGQCVELDRAIQAHCWDGRWFVRAFREDGGVIGAAANAQGRIFLNSQSWAVLSGAATPAQAATAMDAAHELLGTDYGLMLCTPGFVRFDSTSAANILGNPGIKENAGIFCHIQGWAVMAEAMLGHAERAWRDYRAFMPAAFNTRAEVREIEPYVHAQSIHSPHSRKFGVARLPWLTGAATWSYHAATHAILGICPEYDGLRIAPCLPPAWPEIRITRRFRGCRFEIAVRNGPRGTGVRRLRCNGEALTGDLIPAARFLPENRVEVELG